VAAEADIRHAYATFANVNVSDAERSSATEDGEAHTSQADAQWAAGKAQAAYTTFVVDSVRFTGPTSAEVDFHVLYRSGPSPVIPNEVHGGAVLQRGHWRVSKKTGCALSAAAMGQPCAATSPT
jgi:hypothetical protein